MCGIYGQFCFKSAINLDEARFALDKIKHRGPDGYGFEYGNYNTKNYSIHHNDAPSHTPNAAQNYFLGHRRLSIIDLSDNAFQPMESNCQKYSLIFNGEIYNYIELKTELLELGCIFKTNHSDTEVLINAYATWGPDCVNKFRGMFAFAIFNRQDESIFIARDRIGEKTFYYELTEDSLTFASELPPIVEFNHQRKISSTALNLYITLGYIPHPYTIFDGVKKLPPATYATINLKDRTIDLHEYWDVDGSINNISSKEALKNTQEMLLEAVKYRLRADVTVGAFISGGTDSTLIVKNITDLSANKFDVYGADFPNTDRSEKVYIEKAARKYKQNLKLSIIDLSHIKNIESIIKVFDEPFDGASSIALFDLFKEASKDHKVILTGDGGDEMFAGYDRYIDYPKKDKLIRLIRALAFPKAILSFLNNFGLLPPKLRSLNTRLHGNTISNFTGLNTNAAFTEILKPEFKIDNFSNIDIYSDIKAKIKKKGLSTVKALQYLEMKTILPGRMLYKLDRFSMHYGVEARPPFLDHKLVEMAYTLPDKVNISNNTTKMVLKDLLSQDFDANFVHRDKQGFGNPLSNWFKKAQDRDIFKLLLDQNSFIFNYLSYDKTHNLFPQIKQGYKGTGEKELWRLLVLAHYLENYKQHITI